MLNVKSKLTIIEKQDLLAGKIAVACHSLTILQGWTSHFLSKKLD